MILWLNGSFGAGKTTVAHELQRRLPDAFVYDPENVGYFLRKNAPEVCRTEDFQDVPLWRDFNYETLKWIAGTYPGVILAPMTLNGSSTLMRSSAGWYRTGWWCTTSSCGPAGRPC